MYTLLSPLLRSLPTSTSLVLVLALAGTGFFLTPSHTYAATRTLPDTLLLRTPSETLSFSEDTILPWVQLSTAPQYDPKYISEIENIALCPFVPPLSCDAILPRILRYHTVITSHTDIDHEAIKTFVTQAAHDLEAQPVNAVLAGSDGTVHVEQPEQLGFQVNIDESVAAIQNALLFSDTPSITVDVPGTPIEPQIKSSDIEQLGIKDLIAEGTTNFAGSPKNRVFNINRALKQFQGILIAPNEEFSFVKYLGPVDGENGYLPELVIKNNRTEPEFGGGICQVSSTVFRTAVLAGLKITSRRNHAYPVSYYKPYGMDATIYIPNPDLKFINNTPNFIFLQPSISGTALTFQMYGTKDGRKVDIDGPHILESNPDGSMRTIFTETVTGSDGHLILSDHFPSNYKSPALFPHPGQEPVYTIKPNDWSEKQWAEYQRTRTH